MLALSFALQWRRARELGCRMFLKALLYTAPALSQKSKFLRILVEPTRNCVNFQIYEWKWSRMEIRHETNPLKTNKQTKQTKKNLSQILPDVKTSKQHNCFVINPSIRINCHLLFCLIPLLQQLLEIQNMLILAFCWWWTYTPGHSCYQMSNKP